MKLQDFWQHKYQLIYKYIYQRTKHMHIYFERTHLPFERNQIEFTM